MVCVEQGCDHVGSMRKIHSNWAICSVHVNVRTCAWASTSGKNFRWSDSKGDNSNQERDTREIPEIIFFYNECFKDSREATCLSEGWQPQHLCRYVPFRHVTTKKSAFMHSPLTLQYGLSGWRRSGGMTSTRPKTPGSVVGILSRPILM